MDKKPPTAPRLICLFFGLAIVAASLVAIFGPDKSAQAPAAPATKTSAEPFDYFRNSWSVVGLPDYDRGSRITPDNLILLAGTDRVEIEVGDPLAPLGRGPVKTLTGGWMPIVRMAIASGGIDYEVLTWASPLPSRTDADAAFRGPGQGDDYLTWVLVKASNTGKAPAKAALRLRRLRTEKEYAAVAESPDEGKTAAPAVIALHDWSRDLKPGETAEDAAAYTFAAPAAGADPDPWRGESARAWLDKTTAFWKGLLSRAARIEVPEAKASEALLASHVCQLLAMDKGELHAGEGFYDVFYIRDGAYQVMAMEEAGLAEQAARAMEPFLRYQRPDGRLETQKGQFDANGQGVWALWQYARISGDAAFMARAYPTMAKAVEWTIAERKRHAGDPGFPGLLAPAPADGEYLWEGKNHIVGYDLWNLRALVCAADAARRLGKTADAERFAGEARNYRASIEAAWTKTGLPHFPPSWEGAGTHWGNTEILWPVPVFPATDPRIAALSRFVRTEYAGGYKEGVIRWVAPKVKPAIHPYMGAYTTLNDLESGRDEDVVRDFYAYLVHSSSSHAFPEGVHYEERTAWGETIPHATGASNYALLLRHMLIHETGDAAGAGELHLLAAVPDWWLEDGREIVVERAPTRFGEMSLKVRGGKDGVKAEISLPQREKPGKVVLHLPESRKLTAPIAGVEVVYRPAQSKRLDFASAVEEYLKTAPPRF